MACHWSKASITYKTITVQVNLDSGSLASSIESMSYSAVPGFVCNTVLKLGAPEEGFVALFS